MSYADRREPATSALDNSHDDVRNCDDLAEDRLVGDNALMFAPQENDKTCPGELPLARCPLPEPQRAARVRNKRTACLLLAAPSGAAFFLAPD